MTSKHLQSEEVVFEESSALLKSLRVADQRLDELTSGATETAAERDGKSLLLMRVNGGPAPRVGTGAAALLNALPAHIILVDTQGRSISVDDAGRQLDCFNPVIDTNYGLGLVAAGMRADLDGITGEDDPGERDPGHRSPGERNLREGDRRGPGGGEHDSRGSRPSASQVHRLATGIRTVLSGRAQRYGCEYVSRSSIDARWFLVTVTSINEEYPTGALITYMDITAQKQEEARWRCVGHAMDDAVDGVLLTSRSSMRCMHVNDAACRVLHRTREQLLASGPEDAFGTPRADLERVYDELIDSGMDAKPLQMLRVREDGTSLWIELRRRAQFTGDGWTILTFVRDVTERKLAENRMAYLERVNAMLGGINTLIVHEHDRKNLMKRVCKIAAEDGGLRLSMMALVERPALRCVPVGLASKDKPLLSAVKGALLAGGGANTGLIKQAIREKRAIVRQDPQRDGSGEFAKLLIDFGVGSMAIFPLIIGGDVTGVLALYADERQFFHEEAVKLLTGLTNDIAFAMDQIQKRERLEYLTYYDELTRLPNRTLFMEDLTHLLRRAAREHASFALLLFDLRGFRNVNDSLGRPVGDTLLRQVGGWLTCNVGHAKLLARVGIDHFAIVGSNAVADEDLATWVEQLIGAFVAHRFVLDGTEFRIAARVGIAQFPDDGVDADTLLKHAEAALKEAKGSGDRYLFYTQKMTDAVAGKLGLESRLHQALDKDQFVLFYQPKVHLGSGRITGVEALIRWNDPQAGLVLPGLFIGVLEDTGLIREVGRWVLRKAVEDHLRWRSAGLPAVRIAVNVSPLQLRNHGVVRELEKVLAIDPLAAGGLELEMTETLVMEDIERNIESLRAVRDLGVTLAIDDFGTGFSSLSYLAKLPVHTLKIDRSFVTDMTTGPDAIALVSTIVKLAHSMNLNVVAEGVETDQQARLLRLLKCDEMQGYLASMPMSRKQFETRFLTASASV